MLTFEGSPKRKLAPDLDAAKVEEHKKLLNDAQYKHLRAIRLCMKDLGHKAFDVTPRMFIDDVFETCKFMLDSPARDDDGAASAATAFDAGAAAGATSNAGATSGAACASGAASASDAASPSGAASAASAAFASDAFYAGAAGAAGVAFDAGVAGDNPLSVVLSVAGSGVTPLSVVAAWPAAPTLASSSASTLGILNCARLRYTIQHTRASVAKFST
jgi:hypothetical protein